VGVGIGRGRALSGGSSTVSGLQVNAQGYWLLL